MSRRDLAISQTLLAASIITSSVVWTADAAASLLVYDEGAG